MDIQVHFIFVLLIFIQFITLFPSFSSSSSLSTLSISQTSTNQTLICALVSSNSNDNPKQPLFNCTSFPTGIQIPITSPTSSISAITSVNNFLCILRSFQSSQTSVLNCWRFSTTSYGEVRYTNKRIYRGPIIDELDSGNSHICGHVRITNRVQCWQWMEFNSFSNSSSNLSGITVGEEFLCGLTKYKKINCLGNDQSIVGFKPTGDFEVIRAGNRHVCAISTDKRIHCWGEMVKGIPIGEFKSLASGNNRSCGIRVDGTVVCWGENDFHLPKELELTEFMTIESKNNVFCGILARNFSVFCWGNEFFNPYSMVFGKVLPSPCTTTTCPCKPLPDSGKFCERGAICLPCESPPSSPTSPSLPPSAPPLSPPSTPPMPPSSRKFPSIKDGKTVALLVVGSVGTFSLLAVSCYFLFKFCIGRVCRIHDSGRLDQITVEPHQNGSMNNPSELHRNGSLPNPNGQQTHPVQASIERRPSQMFSMSHLEEFTFQTLLNVTENFSREKKIGHGSFGSVYRAVLEDGREVAIKRAELSSKSIYAFAAAGIKRQEDKENAFISEFVHLSRLNHKNLVRLLGFCDEDGERILIYEFVTHGTLHDHLHKLETSPPLNSWTSRIKVALDAARGIEYLHVYAVPKIIHRDIKSSNILLDESWTAKVSDFGLSLIGPEDHESYLSLNAAGTVGYMDPEYYRLQQLTTKSDVYSFGVLLLEMLSGYKAIHPNDAGVPRNIVDYAVPYIEEDEIHCILDTKIPAPTPYEIEAVAYVGYLAESCVNLEGRNRPSMTEVVSCLEKALVACEAPQVLSPSTTRSRST